MFSPHTFLNIVYSCPGKMKRLIRNFLNTRRISYEESTCSDTYMFTCTLNKHYTIPSLLVKHYLGDQRIIRVPIAIKFIVTLVPMNDKEWNVTVDHLNNELCLGRELSLYYIDAVKVDHPGKKKVVTLRKKLKKYLCQ